MSKSTIILTDVQEKQIDSLKELFNVGSKTDVFRKALALALLYKEIHEKNQQILIVDATGTPVERIRIV